MIDMHCHILPGLDDGPACLADSLLLAKQLAEAGFTAVAATPHVLEGRDFLRPATILAAVAELNQRLRQEGIALEVWPGAENYIFPELAQWLADQRLLTLAAQGRHVLVELPAGEIPSYTEQVFFDLQLAGVTPVLAHPERCLPLADAPERLLHWAQRGVLLQLDLRSLLGRYGRAVQSAAVRLASAGLVHLVGTDAHGPASAAEVYREAAALLEQACGPAAVRLLQDNPSRVLAGAEVPVSGDYRLPQEERHPRLVKRIWKHVIRRAWRD